MQFLPLDVTDEDSIGVVLSHIDNAIQFGEHEEPKEPDDVSGFGRAGNENRTDLNSPTSWTRVILTSESDFLKVLLVILLML